MPSLRDDENRRLGRDVRENYEDLLLYRDRFEELAPVVGGAPVSTPPVGAGAPPTPKEKA